MTEMFGWPLLIFLVSPLASNPAKTKEFFPVFGYGHARIGTAISLLGIFLIALGWRKIHQAQGLVTTGIYRYLRHPQYTGIFLFTFGWILHFPSLLIIILWPLLIAAYVWLSFREEKQIHAEFGNAYEEYCRKTKRFIPFVI
jgi:protein-S-isoprenylcysteine O-methyltransferase Ste14